jgi:hypothetical protein
MKRCKAMIKKPARRPTHRFLMVSALASLTFGAALSTAWAQDINPFTVAGEHAAFASQVKQVDMIHKHLHHVMNCLEGPTGKDFDASAGNPCEGSKGALQILPKNSPDRTRAQKAIALAQVGVTLHDELASHYVAEAVHAILTEGQKK